MTKELPQIPFNRPRIEGNEIAYILEAVENGHISGDGPFTRRCGEFLEAELKAPRVLLTTSCSSALDMTGLLLDVQPGDEVIVSSFTFVSTANAFVLRGARPVFSDIRPDTLNMDESLLASLITPRTKAITAVHYAGVGCEMDTITSLAAERNIPIVEDNAHGLFGAYRGRLLGSFGACSTLSFHETKNFSCGEGGALVVNDPGLVERAEIIREKGTNRSRFFRGQVDKYTWVDVGSSFLPSDLLAAVLFAQFERREAIQSRRQAIWETYNAGLALWAAENGFRLPVVPPHCQQTYHMFHLLAPTPRDRDGLIVHLRERGIHSVFHYIPLHSSPMGETFGAVVGDCPVAEDVSARLLRLPFFTGLSEEDLARILEATTSYQPAG